MIVLERSHLRRQINHHVEQITEREIESKNVVAGPHSLTSDHCGAYYRIANDSDDENHDENQPESPSHWRRLDKVAIFGRYDRIIFVVHAEVKNAIYQVHVITLSAL